MSGQIIGSLGPRLESIPDGAPIPLPRGFTERDEIDAGALYAHEIGLHEGLMCRDCLACVQGVGMYTRHPHGSVFVNSYSEFSFVNCSFYSPVTFDHVVESAPADALKFTDTL